MEVETTVAEATPTAEVPAAEPTTEPTTEPTIEPTAEAPEPDFTSDYIDVSELDQYDFKEPAKADPITELTKKLDVLESKLTPREEVTDLDTEEDQRTKKTKSKIDLLMERLDRQEREQKQRELQAVENRIETVNQTVLKSYTEKRLSEALKKSFDVQSSAGIYASNFILADLVNMVEEYEADVGRLIRPKETHAICEQHWKKHAPAIVGNYKTRAASGNAPEATPSDSNGDKLTQEQIDVERELVTLSAEVDKFHNMSTVERQNHKREIDEVNNKIKTLIEKKRLYKN